MVNLLNMFPHWEQRNFEGNAGKNMRTNQLRKNGKTVLTGY